MEDCATALELCGGQLDDAALWLTQNATHVPSDKAALSDSHSPVSFQTVEVKNAVFMSKLLLKATES